MMEIKDIAKLIADAKKENKPVVRTWDLISRYVAGKQSLSFDRKINQFIRRQRTDNRVVINRLLGIQRTVIAKLQIIYPSVGVLPASPSSEDISRAELSEEAIQYNFHNDNMKETLNDHILDLVQFGTAGLHTYYDADIDRVTTKTVSPYDLLVEVGATSIDESRFVAIRHFIQKEVLKKAYPEQKEKIEDYTPPVVDDDKPTEKSLADRCEVFEVYCDDGRHLIMFEGKCLFKGEWDGVHPVCVSRYSKLPREFWGIGLIEPCLELQNLYNQARTQVLKNVELMSNPKWLIPKTSGVSADSIRGKAGEKIYYNPAGGTPQQLAAAPLPSYVFDNIQRLQAEIQDVAGIHNISMGKRTVGVTSGKAIEALASQDVSQLQLTQSSIEYTAAHAFSKVLQLMKAHYTEGKMIAMFDTYGKAVFRELKASNLVENPDVFISASSMFQDTKQTRDAQILELFQLQLVDQETAMRELSFKTGTSFRLQKAATMSHAREALAAVIAGFEIEVMANDDIEAFKTVFSDFIKSSDYYDLPEETQDVIASILNALLVPLDDAALQGLEGKPVVYPRPPAPMQAPAPGPQRQTRLVPPNAGFDPQAILDENAEAQGEMP